MASLSPYAITLGSTDYPVKYAGLLSYVEPYLTNLESFTFSAGNVSLAGNFTLGAASDLTLNKGTANGVLYLNGSKVATSGSALTFDGTNAATTGTSSATKFIPTGGTATGNGMYLSAANTLGWSTNGAKQLELDSSGNLGLGVTPSAWSAITAFQIKSGSVANHSSLDRFYVLSNAANLSTGWSYINSNYALRYEQGADSGQHQWFTAPSGTAGNAISFTQAMTLDASGRLLAGVTTASSGARATFGSAAQASGSACGDSGILLTSTANLATGEYAPFITWSGNATNPNRARAAIGAVSTSATSALDLVFLTRSAADASEIGTGSERARITSGGNLLVGTTSDYLASRVLVKTTTTDSSTNALTLQNSAATDLLRVRSDGYTYAGFYAQTTGSAANVFIGAGGDLLRSTSSLKYKTDVQNATHGLAEVMQLRPVTYKGKNDGDTVFGGLVAEEVHALGLTEFVQYAPDGSPDALAYGNMVSLLIKAIQEQQALITALTARVAALEAQP